MDASLLELAIIGFTLAALTFSHLERGSNRLGLRSEGRMISGVCAGIAARLGVHRGWVRLLLLVSLASGAAVVGSYLILAMAMRWAPGQRDQVWSARLWRRLRASHA